MAAEEHTTPAANGPDLALRSPAPTPAPDHEEQLLAVRRAIYDSRTQAGHWRQWQVTGVSRASEMACRLDRHADVLEHVLRRLIASPATVADEPVTLGTTAARMKQLRALCAAGHLRREELELLASSYLEEPDGDV